MLKYDKYDLCISFFFTFISLQYYNNMLFLTTTKQAHVKSVLNSVFGFTNSARVAFC